MPAIYDRAGVRFLYPENWKLVEDDRGIEPETVSLQSPSGAFWSLMRYRNRENGPELTLQLVAAMQAEYEGLESFPHEETCAPLVGNGYEMCFHCLDFLVTARTVSIQDGDDVLLLLWQAEDRDFGELLPVFRAITTSLLARTPTPATPDNTDR